MTIVYNLLRNLPPEISQSDMIKFDYLLIKQEDMMFSKDVCLMENMGTNPNMPRQREEFTVFQLPLKHTATGYPMLVQCILILDSSCLCLCVADPKVC